MCVIVITEAIFPHCHYYCSNKVQLTNRHRDLSQSTLSHDLLSIMVLSVAVMLFTYLTALYSRGSTLSWVLSDMSSRLICDAIRFVTDTFISSLWPTSSTCSACSHMHERAKFFKYYSRHAAASRKHAINFFVHISAIFTIFRDKFALKC